LKNFIEIAEQRVPKVYKQEKEYLSIEIEDLKKQVEDYKKQIKNEQSQFKKVSEEKYKYKQELDNQCSEISKLISKFKEFEELFSFNVKRADELYKKNTDLNEAVFQLQEKVNTSNKRENKMIYLLYLLRQRGYPVSDIFENEVKNLSTKKIITASHTDLGFSKSAVSKDDNCLLSQTLYETIPSFGGISSSSKMGRPNISNVPKIIVSPLTLSFESEVIMQTDGFKAVSAFPHDNPWISDVHVSEMLKFYQQFQNSNIDSSFFSFNNHLDQEAILSPSLNKIREDALLNDPTCLNKDAYIPKNSNYQHKLGGDKESTLYNASITFTKSNLESTLILLNDVKAVVSSLEKSKRSLNRDLP